MDDVWKLIALLLAGFAGYVTYQQFKLGREKFKLDLFEKRFSVFAAVRKFLSQLATEGQVSIVQVLRFHPGGHPNSPSDGHFKFPQLSA